MSSAELVEQQAGASEEVVGVEFGFLKLSWTWVVGVGEVVDIEDTSCLTVIEMERFVAW